MQQPSWEFVDHERVPDNDNGTLYLMSCGSDYAIHVDGRELMTNEEHGSEDALADLACDRLDDLDSARILVGGLGMGFTLAATLRRIGADAGATVAELMPAVVRWNRDYVGERSMHPLRDPRTSVHVGDVIELVHAPPAPWSAILLDVDNGPGELTRPINAWLYTPEGLATAWQALIPGGILAIWSAGPDHLLTEHLTESGFEVEVVIHHELARPTPDNSGNHVLWMARRPR